MNFKDFIKGLFNKGEDKNYRRSPGRPANVGMTGNVWRHPGVVIDRNYTQHKTREGKLCFQRVKGNKRPPIPTMLSRSVPIAVFKAKMNAIKRRKAGRYVW